MNLLKQLWHDEFGLVLSAEAVCVGTVAVLGAVTGLNLMASAVNQELRDMSFALRSLDQSYVVPGRRSLGARTAMSCFEQEDVNKSLAKLQLLSDRLEKAAAEDQRQRKLKQESHESDEPQKKQEAPEVEREPANAVYYPDA